MMNRIKLLREELKMTQQELANRLGGAKSTVAMYEKEDRNPSLDVLIKLSEIFNCSIDYILGKSDIRYISEARENNSFYLANLGFNMEDYTPPTDAQKKQIKESLEKILEKNKKKN